MGNFLMKKKLLHVNYGRHENNSKNLISNKEKGKIMVRIVNGAIITSNNSNESNLNDNNSNINIFGFKLPTWSIILILFSSFMIGGVPGTMIVSVGLGLGYFLSSDNNSSNNNSNDSNYYQVNSYLFLCFFLFLQ